MSSIVWTILEIIMAFRLFKQSYLNQTSERRILGEEEKREWQTEERKKKKINVVCLLQFHKGLFCF